MSGQPDLNQFRLPLVLVHQRRRSWALESRWVLGCHTVNGQQRLTLKGPGHDRYVAFNGEVEFIELPAAKLHPLPALMQARKTFPAIKALVEHQDQLLVLLDALLLDEDTFSA
ncbi:hypothetical protein GLV89_11710 [Halomonas alkaliantarctica]|nr:hypothetical protein [Halomonas alkaliantarctica]